MRAVAVIALQLLIALLVTGAVFPLLLFSVPIAREGRVGGILIFACPILIFLTLRVLWRKAKG